MLSRVADSVFWMARYLERTDNLLRLLRTDYIAAQDELLDYDWQLLSDSFGSDKPEQKKKVSNYREALHHLLLSRQHESSVFTNILRVRENARSVQDYITKELWQALNDYYHHMLDGEIEDLIIHDDPVTAFDTLLLDSIIFYGTVDVTMNRGEGYTFLNLGKYMERCLQNLDILEFKQKQKLKTIEAVHWKYLLYALSGYEFHSKHYKNALNSREVIHQTLFNIQFPHSVSYSLAQMHRYFLRLKDLSQPEHFSEIESLVVTMIKTMETYQLDYNDETVQKIIDDLRKQFTHLNNRLAVIYFGHT